MQIDWIHPPDTLNLCFNALDRHVIRGRADEPAIAADRPTSYARLLEEVAAFGGVLRAFGVGLADTVVARLPPGRDSLVALLASTRVGAVHVLEGPVDDEGTVVVPGGVVTRGGASSPDHLDWDVVLRAGRTDPAPCAEVAATAPALVADGRTLSTTEILERSTGWPYAALATLLGGGTIDSWPVDELE